MALSYPTMCDGSLASASTAQETVDVVVPQQFSTLRAAVNFANQQLRKQSNKTIRILLEPNYRCDVEESVIVDYAADQCQLIIDVVDPASGPAHFHMDTTEPNQPLFRISRGNVTIRNLHIEHCSAVDLNLLTRTKNSNAAVVLEPLDQTSTLFLEQLFIVSYSGKGIINRLADPHAIQQNDVFIAKMWQ